MAIFSFLLELSCVNRKKSSEKNERSHKLKTTYWNYIIFGYFVEIIIKNWTMSFFFTTCQWNNFKKYDKTLIF